ncbi:hypothetical protein QDD82_005320 [Burkholderia cepacia]|nr:hypothetical protein [Burkholderia cepacia]MBG0862622.1 hypothetical protein [Burkholderia sp. 9779_493]MBJ9924535.1 hypothetical protein [Burkholderia cenocepacia]
MSGIGLQLWDASGRIVLDGTTRCARIVDMFEIPQARDANGHPLGYGDGQPGRHDVNLSAGEPFWSFMPDFLFKHISMNAPVPIFEIDSRGISWHYSTTNDGFLTPVSGWCVVGVY